MRLSICIPTYNRSEDLRQLLESISIAIKNSKHTIMVEVIVSDNASTDDTLEIVQRAKTTFNNIVYSRNIQNEGYASNLNKTIQLASGDYCWLMGSDDKLLPASIASVLDNLMNDASVYIGKPITNGKVRSYFYFNERRVYQFQSDYTYQQFLLQCTEISSTFAFMSTLIIKREFWNSIELTSLEAFHPYTHMLRIIKGLITQKKTVCCLNVNLVTTGHNENEFNKTVLPHFELDLLTIEYILKEYFNNSNEICAAYGKIFRRQYTTIESYKARIESSNDRWNTLKPTLRRFGYSSIFLNKKIYDRLLLKIYFLIKKYKNILKNSLINTKIKN
jgi:abequosyltransferase